MSEQTVIAGPGASLGPSCAEALGQVEPNEILSLRFEDDRGVWEAVCHELSRHGLTRVGEGPTQAAAIASLRPIQFMRKVEDYIPEREWITEDPLSPEELEELKQQAAS